MVLTLLDSLILKYAFSINSPRNQPDQHTKIDQNKSYWTTSIVSRAGGIPPMDRQGAADDRFPDADSLSPWQDVWPRRWMNWYIKIMLSPDLEISLLYVYVLYQKSAASFYYTKYSLGRTKQNADELWARQDEIHDGTAEVEIVKPSSLRSFFCCINDILGDNLFTLTTVFAEEDAYSNINAFMTDNFRPYQFLCQPLRCISISWQDICSQYSNSQQRSHFNSSKDWLLPYSLHFSVLNNSVMTPKVTVKRNTRGWKLACGVGELHQVVYSRIVWSRRRFIWPSFSTLTQCNDSTKYCHLIMLLVFPTQDISQSTINILTYVVDR
jgi:hypothetical protein